MNYIVEYAKDHDYKRVQRMQKWIMKKPIIYIEDWGLMKRKCYFYEKIGLVQDNVIRCLRL